MHYATNKYDYVRLHNINIQSDYYTLTDFGRYHSAILCVYKEALNTLVYRR